VLIAADVRVPSSLAEPPRESRREAASGLQTTVPFACLHKGRRANSTSKEALLQQLRAAKAKGKASCKCRCRRTAHAPLTQQAHNEAELRPQTTTPFPPCCCRTTNEPLSIHDVWTWMLAPWRQVMGSRRGKSQQVSKATCQLIERCTHRYRFLLDGNTVESGSWKTPKITVPFERACRLVSIFALFQTTVKVTMCYPRKANLQEIRQGCLGEIKKRQTPTSWCDRFRAERVPRSGTCVHLLMHAGAGSSPHSLLSCSRRTLSG
jgi:hypothetical protein